MEAGTEGKRGRRLGFTLGTEWIGISWLQQVTDVVWEARKKGTG